MRYPATAQRPSKTSPPRIPAAIRNVRLLDSSGGVSSSKLVLSSKFDMVHSPHILFFLLSHNFNIYQRHDHAFTVFKSHIRGGSAQTAGQQTESRAYSGYRSDHSDVGRTPHTHLLPHCKWFIIVWFSRLV